MTLRAIIAAFALLLVIPAVAAAKSTVTYTPRDLVNGPEFPEDAEPSFIEVTGDDGVNTLTLTRTGTTVTITDASGVTAGTGCTQAGATSATCPEADTSYVDVKGGGDRVTADPALGTDVEAGAGTDVVTTAGPMRGGDGDDVLTSTGGGQLTEGDAGDDDLTGSDGDDSLLGGTGTDTLRGGAGDDQLDGDEPLTEGTEPDTLDGGPGTDTLDWDFRKISVVVDLTGGRPSGAPGENEKLSGIDRVETGDGYDVLIGTDAPDRFDPGAGNDQVASGGGNDIVEGSGGDDQIDLGAGTDTISYRDSDLPVNVNLADPGPDGAKGSMDELSGVENVIGSEPQDDFKGDVLIGDSGPNVLSGLLGSDRISGGGGRDRLYGEGRPRDVTDSSPADGVNIDLTYPAVDRLRGGAGDDVLVGGIDGDRLDGGSGDDRMLGDLGRGFVGGEPRSAMSKDIVVYSSRKARIKASTRSGGGQRGEADSYRGVEGIRGGSGNDTLSGRFGRADLLFGGRGNDRLNGRSGKDTLRGEAGRDFLKANDGQRDKVDCGSNRDSFRADAKDRVKRCERRR